MIHAPFNFVPLSDNVVFPEWADQISQDIPFSDGISGSFCVNIEAITPLFVRNGHIMGIDKQSDEFKSFSKNPKGEYFIPATSIKGELRHLLEIISFSKMQRVDDKRYGIRDINNKQYRESFPYESIHCGWMDIKDDGIVEISDNGIPYRVSHKQLDFMFDTDFCHLFGEEATIKDSNRTAEYKYNLCASKNLLTSVYSFKEYKLYPSNESVDKRMGVRFFVDGPIRGKVVFTGQPGNRKERKEIKNSSGETVITKASGKFFEFVFKEIENPRIYTVKKDEELFKDFEFIYKDSTDWHFWKNKAKKEGLKIPVFFKIENDKIVTLGLSYLYKLPYNKRIKQCLGEQHNSNKYDLSECIFGEIKKKDSLKGRVQISHALCDEEYPFEIEGGIAPYMGSPKPTYYPIYLEQKGENGFLPENGKFSTMMDKNARLRGWKMYPARKYYQKEFSVEENQQDNTNPSIPLGAGSKFKFRVRFHNLKPVELGAILYSVKLQKQSCHTLGFGKAFGYGVCKYTIADDIIGFSFVDIDSYIKSFTDYMEDQIPDYKKSPQFKELMTMLIPVQEDQLRRPLEYMVLEDFVKCKQHNPKNKKKEIIGEYLPPYSTIVKPAEKLPKAPSIGEAVITYPGNPKQAKLKQGNDTKPKDLDMNGKQVKLKIGDVIEVEIINGGKKLRFIKKK